MSAPPTVLGVLVRRLRLERGWSQEGLARHAGICTGSVSALERGRSRNPHPHTLHGLATALKVDAQILRQARDADRQSPAPSTVLGANVRERRVRLGWTQRELASCARLAQSTIALIESGQRRSPRHRTLLGLAAAFGVRARELTKP